MNQNSKSVRACVSINNNFPRAPLRPVNKYNTNFSGILSETISISIKMCKSHFV